MAKKDFNDNHPEMQKEEAFIGNFTEEFIKNKLYWKTGRIGKVAYDAMGRPIKDRFPLFVQRCEKDENDREIKLHKY